MSKYKTVVFIILSSVLLTIILKFFVIQLYDYHDDSMEKSILEGEKVLINKTVKGKVNDVILYRDSVDCYYLSRLVATENDEVIFTDNKIYINGNELIINKSINEYYMYFINKKEFNKLKYKYDIRPINKSGTYKILLTKYEYDKIINDSLFTVGKKIIQKSNYSFCFYQKNEADTKFIVPNDSVYVLNDNRTNLNDSRRLRFIPKKNIIGKVVYIF